MNNIEKTSEFVIKAKKVHGNRYDYSKVEYIGSKGNVCIICPIHGEFWQTAYNHSNGCGCKKCGLINSAHKQACNIDTFITKAKKVHGDKYDYSKVKYINNRTKVCIICKKHGEFYQVPSAHSIGQGCKECGNLSSGEKKTSNTSTFIYRAKVVHGDKYDYSKVKYINNRTKVCIICPTHGEFDQVADYHINGCGCKECGKKTFIEKKTSNTSTFINRCKGVHGNKYDYSKVMYKNGITKVSIICPIHGEFEQKANCHLYGAGCYECGKFTISEKKSSDTPTFIEKCNVVHGDKYDYSKVEYKNAVTKVIIICPIHGEFEQVPNSHLSGSGCPKCFGSVSKQETEIGDYIESLGLEVIRSDKTILSGSELDIYIPRFNIAIEYNGLYWHSEEQGKDKNYHLNKTLMCKEQGIGLIHIFEDEYLSNKDIVLNKLKHILKVQDNSPRIMGRKCTIEVINNETAKSFINTYHIQGYGASTVHLGAIYDNELIAVMSFKKCGKESLRWELLRFASNSAYICQGVGGKLFNHFIKIYNPSEVKSFADRRWTLNEEDKLYIKLGFEKIDDIVPDYKYITRTKRIHKTNKIAKVSNYNKVWDCGLFKYVWSK